MTVCDNHGHEFFQVAESESVNAAAAYVPRFICRKCGEVKTLEAAK